jgi:chromosome transmission fidelity protein 4
MDDLLNLIDEDDTSNDTVTAKKSAKDIKSPLKKRKRLSDSLNEEEGQCLEEELEMEQADEEDDDMESLEKLKEKTLKSVRNDLMLLDIDQDGDEMAAGEEVVKTEVQVVTKLPVTQAPFQPASTPLNLTERYMAWNNIGLITQFMKENDDSIDIEFHNATYHHTIHLKNQFGYTMADMSTEAVLMASPGKRKSYSSTLITNNAS